jgi:hypothetical protein
MAAQYAAWAEKQIEAGRLSQAEQGLLRAQDFADVSSDISYLLAKTHSRLNRPQGAVLLAVRQALEARRWDRRSADEARLLEAEVLIRTGALEEAYGELLQVPVNLRSLELRLLALKLLGRREAFLTLAEEAFARYPGAPGPLALYFTYCSEILPQPEEFALMNRALSLVPALMRSSPELVYLSLPFIQNEEQKILLLEEARAAGQILPESIPAAIKLGIITENTALEELFASDGLPYRADTRFPVLRPWEPALPGFSYSIGTGGFSPEGGEKAYSFGLLSEVWELLRTDEGRRIFIRNLGASPVVLLVDDNRDGFPEAFVRYRHGEISSYGWDSDQDGLLEMEIRFARGRPEEGRTVLAAASPGPSFPVRDEDRAFLKMKWGVYPAITSAETPDLRFSTPGEAGFPYSPLSFRRVFDTGEAGPYFGFLFPERNPGVQISLRILAAEATLIERASADFPGAVERISLSGGIPLLAETFYRGRLVSETRYTLGRPVSRMADFDLDFRLETRIQYIQPEGAGWTDFGEYIEYIESDFDGDGIFEYSERRQGSRSVEFAWDLDGDGYRERVQTRELASGK